MREKNKPITIVVNDKGRCDEKTHRKNKKTASFKMNFKNEGWKTYSYQF